MKSIILLFSILLSLGVSAQECPYMRVEFADMTIQGSGGGIWTGRYNFTDVEKDGLPPHAEFFMGNFYIKNKAGEQKNDLISVYGFSKEKYTNFVKLYSWKGYETKIVESYARIWVIIYNDKVPNAEQHEWCMKKFEQVVSRCHGNPNF